ncbi:MAG: divalent metal cation transporter [Vulcanimicrobiaceae bacterium]
MGMTKPTAARRRKPVWHYFGPGLISGASDNDPTTVGSLAVIGATTVYGLGWLVLLVIPMLAVVQMISAQVGAVTKRGLEHDTRAYLGRASAIVMLVSVLAVNVVTLIADVEGGGAAMQILTGIDYRVWALPLGAASVAMLIVGSYERIKRVLVVFPLIFLCYPIAAILAHPDWHAVLRDSFVPHFRHTADYAAGAIALLGTTLTSYAYVWQTVETARERPPLSRLGLVQADAALGTVVAGLSFWSIVIATGATLGVHHKAVTTADEAARALAPLAGHFSSLLFGVGLLGSSLIAVPILIATSAYVLSDMVGWRSGLDATFWRARRFYFTMAAVAAVAVAGAVLGVPPIKALFVSSIVGGIGTPVTLSILLLLARNKSAMKEHPVGPALTLAGWTVAAIVSIAAIIYLWSTFVH